MSMPVQGCVTSGVAVAFARDSDSNRESLAFLLDVDNTLLDNDRFGADLGAYFQDAFGVQERDRYWKIYAQLRDQAGYADYLGAVQIFRGDAEENPELLNVAQFMLEYPFAQRLYPHALETLAHLHTLGSVTIVSDGDIVFQPRKIRRSGLWQAVAGRVLIYLHKQQQIEAIQRHCPAQHYVMVDDKPQLLADMKRQLGDSLTTVFVRQGHYALDPVQQPVDPAPDHVIECVGDLRNYSRADFLLAAGGAR